MLGDFLLNTSVGIEQFAEMTDEQVLLVLAASQRQKDSVEGKEDNEPQNFVLPIRTEDELQQQMVNLGAYLGMPVDEILSQMDKDPAKWEAALKWIREN